MRIDIKQLETGGSVLEKSRNFEYQVDLSSAKLWGENPFVKPVHVIGSVTNRAGIVTVRYSVSYTKSGACSRCLTPMENDCADSFEHIILENLNKSDTPADVNDEFILAVDGVLDMDELVSADVLLSQDYTMLCSDECKGLCPKCGINLNESVCSCSTREPDSRFAALFKLMEQNENE